MMGLLKMELNRGKEKYPLTTVIIIKDGGKTTNHMGTAIISSHREIFTMVSFKMEKDMEKALIHIKMEISIMEIGKMMPSKVRAESQWFRVILIGGDGQVELKVEMENTDLQMETCIKEHFNRE